MLMWAPLIVMYIQHVREASVSGLLETASWLQTYSYRYSASGYGCGARVPKELMIQHTLDGGSHMGQVF